MSSMLINGFFYAVTGAIIGLLSGILGIGGGIIIIPVLLFFFQQTPSIPLELNMHLAIGSSLAIMIITSFASIRAHAKHGEILFHIYKRLVWGLSMGTLTGCLTAFFISPRGLNILLVIFLLAIAFKMLFDKEHAPHFKFPATALNLLITFLIGFQSGLLGIGGGTLLLPYLTYCGVEIRKIAGVLALCTMTVSLLGTIMFVIMGTFDTNLPQYSIGYVYWPVVLCIAIPSSLTAPIGSRLSYVLPVKQLKYSFIVLLIITAIDLL